MSDGARRRMGGVAFRLSHRHAGWRYHPRFGGCPMLASTPGACITWDACDPVFQRGCSAGKGRQLLFDGTTDGGASQCVPGGAAAVGDPCPSFELAGMSPCVPGSQCYARPLPDGAGALDVGLAGACPSAQTCVPPREWIAIHSPTPAGICI